MGMLPGDGSLAPPALPDGFVAVVKRDCPTCALVVPALHELGAGAPGGAALTVYTQDDPVSRRSTTWRPGGPTPTSTPPTASPSRPCPPCCGSRAGRDGPIVGWSRDAWRAFTGIDDLGADLPEHRPGCGSLTLDPTGREPSSATRAGGCAAARSPWPRFEDDGGDVRPGWTDSLPVVPPTPPRAADARGHHRDPDDLVAIVPPDLVPCSVEKVAVNAVLAGCKPEYLPVVLAAVEAACTDEFNMHGLLATTYFSGPVVIVNGPVTRAIGMNSGVNALGQGNRANATIGRALQLIVRNVGGGEPGGSTAAGNPGSTLLLRRDEDGSPWESLAASEGSPGA
jgi:hypothetical protein